MWSQYFAASEKKFRKFFHDPGQFSQDYKIRFALTGTDWEGAYMTDLIKDFEEKALAKVSKYIREKPEFLFDNGSTFKKELSLSPASSLTIVSISGQVFDYLKKYVTEYRVVKEPHFFAFYQ